MTINKTTTDLSTLKINYLTQEMYEDALENEEINENELYITPGSGTIDSTSAPTANKIAEFDSTAHMNSTDMTSQEVDDFVDGLNVGGVTNLLDPFAVSWQSANITQITKTAGSAKAFMLANGQYVVFFAFAFSTNTTRGASTAVFRLVSEDGYVLQGAHPYFFTCITSGSMGNSYTNTDGYWFNTNVQWTANTEYRVSGVGIFTKTSTHI